MAGLTGFSSEKGAPPDRYAGLRVLFIPLEFLRWEVARPLNYTGGLALEEGLAANGVEVFTLPTYGGVSSAAPGSWLRQAKRLVGDRRFDQVWITLVHNDFAPEFFKWLATLAPVRVGFICESLHHSREEIRRYPARASRQYVLSQASSLTHLLCVDEADAARINLFHSGRALWWPSTVPRRAFVLEPGEGIGRPAAFYGSVYGDRAAWLAREEFRQILQCPPPPEASTDLPSKFDELHASTTARLTIGPPATEDLLRSYLERWRGLRREMFELWMSALRDASAQVNLPSIVKAFAGRVIESMAAGCPVISWDIPNRPRNRRLFREGDEILFFRKDRPEDLAAHIRRLQHEPEWARALARRAHRKGIEFHTTERRIEQVLDWIETGTAPDYGEAAVRAGTRVSAALLIVAREAAVEGSERGAHGLELLERRAVAKILPLLPRRSKDAGFRWAAWLGRQWLRFSRSTGMREFAGRRLIAPYLIHRELDFRMTTHFGMRIEGNTADFIQKYIYFLGVWEPNLSAWIERSLKPGDGFVDVGANVGYFSLLAAARVGRTGSVVAIEASPATFARLQRNLALNPRANVRALNFAASDAERELQLYLPPGTDSGRVTTVGGWARDRGFTTGGRVRALPLNAMLDETELKKARVIKIDVEGHEPEVLAGLRPALAGCRRDLEIVVEVTPEGMAERGMTAEALLAPFADCGFNFYEIVNDYNFEACLRTARPSRPKRLVDLNFRNQRDLILSRADAPEL